MIIYYKGKIEMENDELPWIRILSITHSLVSSLVFGRRRRKRRRKKEALVGGWPQLSSENSHFRENELVALSIPLLCIHPSITTPVLLARCNSTMGGQNFNFDRIG